MRCGPSGGRVAARCVSGGSRRSGAVPAHPLRSPAGERRRRCPGGVAQLVLERVGMTIPELGPERVERCRMARASGCFWPSGGEPPRTGFPASSAGLTPGRKRRRTPAPAADRSPRTPSRWMAGRSEAILGWLEVGGAPTRDLESTTLRNFDRTRWRRRAPSKLIAGRPKSFGDRLRQRRLELGPTHVPRGVCGGGGRGSVCRWGRGRCAPAPARCRALERRIGIGK